MATPRHSWIPYSAAGDLASGLATFGSHASSLWVIDLACVLLFVGIGRSVHAHGSSIAGMASTAWPFVTGLAVGWGALGVWRSPGAAVRSGVIVTASTVVVGMILRVISGQGTAFAFILVAFGFLGGTMVGWRLVGIGLGRVRAAGRPS